MEQDWKERVLAEVRDELERMEAEGRAPRDVAELELMTIQFTQHMGKRTWEQWMKARAEEAHFSP